jgi:signal transduction histidine kinase
MAPLEKPLTAHLRENLLWGGGTILVTTLIANLVVSRMAVRRLEGLAEALFQFGEGNLDLRLPDGDPDEIGQLISSFNEMGQRIQTKTEQNIALADELRRQSEQRGELLKRLIHVQEDERKRVARELHDELGQSLSALALQTQVAKGLIPPEDKAARDQLEETRKLISATTDQMYALILALRPSVLDDLGLVAAVRAHAERLFEKSEIEYSIKSNRLEQRLPPEVETTLYRIYQEALNNALRHSGANHVRITFSKRGQMFKGAVFDNGHGFNPESIQMDGTSSDGLGLLGMQERAAQCGGRIEVSSKPGEGTEIKIHIPLEADCA